MYRTHVLLSPSVSYLLRALTSIARLEKRNYGGAVLNVLSSLEAAISDPWGGGSLWQKRPRRRRISVPI